MSGFVSLVGAGPGDPELLTLRALKRLREANLVLNDALVPSDLLELAPTAQRFYVGKRAGRHSIDQEGIHGLMIRAAQRGQRVVRLKAGDPFVLGRGGEEALALEAAGIAYEVVPGLSSALAAPALAGIPVTHRGLAAGFAVISGHAESAYGPLLDGIAPQAMTIVVLMGVKTRAAGHLRRRPRSSTVHHRPAASRGSATSRRSARPRSRPSCPPCSSSAAWSPSRTRHVSCLPSAWGTHGESVGGHR